MKRYEIVYADFPWPYTSFGTAKLQYDQMSEREISEFDWGRFLAKRAAVFSWVTGPKLDLALRCAEQWKARHGLAYQGVAYVWVKTTKDGTPIRASGPRPRFVKPLDEFLLVFSTHPNERVFPLLSESQVQHVLHPDLDETVPMLPGEYPAEYVLAPKQALHSRKPPVFRDMIVELLGDRPRIELFARERWPGWDVWGHECGASEPELVGGAA
jgi:Transcriptional activator, adenine-specific DNA methyltransferase